MGSGVIGSVTVLRLIGFREESEKSNTICFNGSIGRDSVTFLVLLIGEFMHAKIDAFDTITEHYNKALVAFLSG